MVKPWGAIIYGQPAILSSHTGLPSKLKLYDQNY